MLGQSAFSGAMAGLPAGAVPGLLGRLSSLLEPLDYPRQALTNLVGGAGSLNWESMLPGALGLAAGGFTAASGMAPLAPLIGSLVSGAAQGIGLASDPETYRAPTTGEVSESLGLADHPLTNFAVGMMTDPLTLGGMGVGGMLGEAKGTATGLVNRQQQLGREIEQINRLADVGEAWRPGVGWHPESMASRMEAQALSRAAAGEMNVAGLGGPIPYGPPNPAGRGYRVSRGDMPAVEQLAGLGMGEIDQAGRFRTPFAELPPQLDVRRGGWMGPTPAAADVGELGPWGLFRPGPQTPPDLAHYYQSMTGEINSGRNPLLSELMPESQLRLLQEQTPGVAPLLGTEASQWAPNLGQALVGRLRDRELLAQALRESNPATRAFAAMMGVR